MEQIRADEFLTNKEKEVVVEVKELAKTLLTPKPIAMVVHRANKGQCRRCGGKIKQEAQRRHLDLCSNCERKMNVPISLMYKGKGGLFKLDVRHMVNPKNLAGFLG